MFERWKQFYRTHLRLFVSLFFTFTILTWLVGPVLLNLLSLTQSFAVSFAIVILMLATTQDYLNDLVNPVKQFVTSASQAEQNHQIYDLIRGRTLGVVRMIEYDSESTKPLICSFLEQGASVHCLLQHPNSAINERQRQRTIMQILTFREEYEGYLDKIKFSYYEPVASLRARHAEGLFLSLGWYTYDRRDRIQPRQVWGHNNPNLLVDLRQTAAVPLIEFFNRIFQNLLADSVPWDDLYAEYEQTFTVIMKQSPDIGGSVNS